ncbi:hypothetical protein [Congzhengia sp.]|uniref:hypothetical protein n=1 Tax=Congzhengia sp. TaxID=2944168 RepID=UPI003076D1E9
MAEYDGSIKFDTKINTDEFKKGIAELSKSTAEGTEKAKQPMINTVSAFVDLLKKMADTSNNSTAKGLANVAGLVKDIYKDTDISKLTSGLDKAGEEFDGMSILADTATTMLKTFATVAVLAGPELATLATLVAGAGVGFTELSVQLNDNMTTLDDFYEAEKNKIQALGEEKEAWKNLKLVSEENTAVETAKIDRAIALQGELAKIADETGKVSNADKARASYILGEMNQALGTEFTMTGNVIDQYGTMAQTISKVSDASKARAVLEANQAVALAAKMGQEQKIIELAEQRVLMEDTLQAKAALTAEKDILEKDGQVGKAIELGTVISELNDVYEDQQKTYNETEAQADAYGDTLEKYGAIEEAIANGSAVDINKAVSEFQETMKSGDSVITSSSKAIDDAGLRLKNCKEAYKIAKDMFLKNKLSPEELEKYRTDLINAADGYAEIGGTAMAELLSGFETSDEELYQTLATIAGTSVDTFKQTLGLNPATNAFSSEVGAPMVQGITVGAQSESGILNAAMRKIVRDAINAAKDEGVIESPSHVMRDEVGLMFSKGLALGITDGKDEVVSAAEGVANAAISAASSISAADVLAKLSDSFINGLKENDKGNTEKYQDKLEILDYKQAFGGLSTEDYYAEMERLRDQYLTAYTKEWFDATEKIYDHQKEMAEEVRDKALDELDKQHDKGLMSEAQYIAELTAFRDRYYAEGTEEYAEMTEDIAKLSRENELDMLDFHYDMGLLTEQDYYQKLLEYRDKHFAVGSAEWMEYTKKICSYNKSQIQKAYDEIAEYAGEKLSDLLSKQEALYGKLDGYGSLMKTVTVKNYYEDGSDLQFNELNDISKDNDFLRQYNENITAAAQRLKASGLDEAAAAKLYDELLGMSPEEASDFAALLTKATDEEFEKYLADYKENMDLLDEVSKNPFREEWKEATEDIVSELKEAGFEVPEAFSDIGEDAAMEFSRSFLEELQTQMEDIKTQITGWSFTLVPQVVGASANGESRVFSPTYHLYGSGETDVQRIQSAKAISEQHRMAGGY